MSAAFFDYLKRVNPATSVLLLLVLTFMVIGYRIVVDLAPDGITAIVDHTAALTMLTAQISEAATQADVRANTEATEQLAAELRVYVEGNGTMGERVLGVETATRETAALELEALGRIEKKLEQIPQASAEAALIYFENAYPRKQDRGRYTVPREDSP